MPDPNLFRLRMTFCKQGRMAMLSAFDALPGARGPARPCRSQ